ncbi:MAG: PH domain-containing protein [Acetobacterales bacterium]
MRYIEGILAEGEQVVAEIRYHWWFWVRAFVVFVIRAAIIGIIVYLVLDFIAGMESTSKDLYRQVVYGLGALAGLWALLKLAVRVIEFLTTERAVTARRLVYKQGLIARRTAELGLHRIEEINLEQSVLGRILGYGTLSIAGTGGDDRLVLAEVADPVAVRRAIDAQPAASAPNGN